GGVILLLHVVGFGLLAYAIPHHYQLGQGRLFGLGTGVLAYTLGVRHAFDADHIAAIDNTTRKLMAEDQRPIGSGFFFSLGHSTVVFLLALALALGLRALSGQISAPNSVLHHYTGLIGASVSGGFLYLIAGLNLVILVGVAKLFLAMRRGRYSDRELDAHLDARGFMARFFGPMTRSVDATWKLYPVGFLFGLGFDTASEIALLVLAGTSVGTGLPVWAILSLPVLFAAGMALFDTADGSFMNLAYDWAFARPVRKVYYNLVITGLSVGVALIIGTIEFLSVLQAELGLSGGVWNLVRGFNINVAGYVVVGLFVVTWAVAVGYWHLGRVEARLGSSASRADAEEGDRP
ncbi:MAG TPA: HoxN/HupN/NixA family nickel/cobalt transporter, partial [Acidimicrobiales bacterium]|nr:HoxN/HupN/NixA family nickel/cobalt transporter [Acidimicrobiales bacterium]